MNQTERRAAFAVGLLYLARMLGLFMALPVLPLVAERIPGATPLLLGLALGAYGLLQALLQIPLGLASDRFGRRPIIALGLGLFILGCLVCAYAPNIHWLIAGRCLQGCGALASVLLALMTDLTRADQRAKAFGVIGAAIAASFGMALALGPLALALGGMAAVFLVAAVLGLLGLGALFALVPSPGQPSSSAATASRLAEVAKDQRLWGLNLCVFLLHFQFISAFFLMPLLLAREGVPPLQHAFHYLWLLALAFLLALPGLWLGRRLADSRLLLAALVALMGLSLLLLAASQGLAQLLLGALLFLAAFCLMEILLPASVSRLAGAASRGTAMGFYSSCQFAGIFAGGMASGWLLGLGDLSLPLLAGALLCLVWLAALLAAPKLGKAAR